MLYWRSGTKIMPISDMTNEHIQNAINYINRQPNISIKDTYAIEALRKEQTNRKRNKIIETTKRICPFCKGGVMIMTEHVEEPDPEACTGFGGFPKYTHSLVCQKCGASGPEKRGKIEDGQYHCTHEWVYSNLIESGTIIGKRRACTKCQTVEYRATWLETPWIEII